MSRTLTLAFAGALSLAAPTLGQPTPPPGPQQDPLLNTCGKLAGFYEVTWPDGRRSRARLRSAEPDRAQLSLDLPLGGTVRPTLIRRLTSTENRLRTEDGMSGGLDPSQRVRADLKVKDRITLEGSVSLKRPDGSWKPYQVTLARAAMPARSPEEMGESDPGPSPEQKQLFESVPADFEDNYFDSMWTKWGPTYYRGRLDKSARVMIIGSDPGPTECVPFARRCMIGDTGQRVQGLLHKLGLDRSYLIMNAFPYALFPSASNAGKGDEINANPTVVAWRNKIFASAIDKDKLQAVILFGFQARAAWDLWTDHPNVPIFELPHPSRFDGEPDAGLLSRYRPAVERLRQIVTPDDEVLLRNNPNYGKEFTEFDFGRIPRRDLPKEAVIGGVVEPTPEWFGSDSWTRVRATPIHNVVQRAGSSKMVFNFPDGTTKYLRVIPAATAGGQPTYRWE